MCGIAFLFEAGASKEAAVSRTLACLEAMRHRGPDDGRLNVAGGAVIGHRRLSIIDLSGSTQPMSDPLGRYWLTYNGEIYNFAEIRRSLERRWNFATHGDTEVLLAGLVLDGVRFLDRLEGMWAFALWDVEAQQLLLGRDRMGKKPLFFQRLHSGGLACASELPALRKLSAVPWHEDLDSTADYLRYGYAMPGYTAWREVQEIRPGAVAYWKPGEAVSQVAWWELRPACTDATTDQAQAQLRESLITAVRRRLVADVDVGAFLSGGIDSSLICAIVRLDLGLPLKTFTIGFRDTAFDERRFARAAADHLATDHYDEVLEEWDERRLERLILDHVGQPFADSSLLPTALVSEVAAKRVKVALSGDGGDELFSGYQRYQARNILRWYSRLPSGLRHLAEKTVRALPEPTAHHSRSLLKKAHLFMDIVERQKAETPYFAPVMFSPTQMRRLAPDLTGMGHPPVAIPPQTELDDITRMMFADALIYLPQDILVKVDRASMAHSLEARAPFLDRSVVELAFSMPRRWHRRWGSGKRMLRGVFGSHLPWALWRRRKQGFGVPIHAWFRGSLGERLVALANEVRSPLSARMIEGLLAAHTKGGRDNGYRLWIPYAYLLWRHHEP